MMTKAFNCYCHLPPKFPDPFELQILFLLSCAREHLQPPAFTFLQHSNQQLTQIFAPKRQLSSKKIKTKLSSLFLKGGWGVVVSKKEILKYMGFSKNLILYWQEKSILHPFGLILASNSAYYHRYTTQHKINPNKKNLPTPVRYISVSPVLPAECSSCRGT